MSRTHRTDLTAVEPEEAVTCAGVRYAATAYRPGGVTGPAAGCIEFPPGWTKCPPLPAHVPAVPGGQITLIANELCCPQRLRQCCRTGHGPPAAGRSL